VSAPRALHVRQRLGQLDFLAVADFFLSETAQLADVVLPAAQWAEDGGTMTNLEGRVILRRPAVPPPDSARPDWRILCDLANRLGAGRCFAFAGPESIFAELRRASAGGPADYSGISYQRLAREDGIFWPCPDEGHPGTPRPFAERFPTPDGRARFHAVKYRPPAEEPDARYPLYLTTGRLPSQYQSGSQTRRITALLRQAPEPLVEIHPATAARFGLRDGQPVQLRSPRGAATLRARLTDAIRPDTLFAPFHWGGDQAINNLTNPALDPVSRMPEFKVCAAAIEPISPGEDVG
ncbi:MAG: molybdopterin-dependent oxidoreductase, partial [Chloroflexota bacterium]|nr:molybdopterin-dependent oxidoreductase [Chloroflexota bacterium]